ncbi:hypothetical protein CLAFUW4_09938 [Fulvia fulva]|nr:hypothetical protein CLAFUR4_09942 [Fulvia fulva]WPV19537.1 hypothetical protein CLAFUW4_09938 [Fulvia fulva]WPV34010.1 hypothetical protein CLAFUW7_09939 [Fulvia fulva]
MALVAATNPNLYRSRSRKQSTASNSSRHKRPEVPCLGCDLNFNTYADMIYHLESMTCMSGLDTVSLNSLAAQCRYHRDFVNPEARMELLNDSMDFPTHIDRPFWCPCCTRDFPRLSGLFEHCERHSSDRRHRSGSIKKLQEWLDDATSPR